MITSFLQRLSVGFFAACRRGLMRSGRWLEDSPGLSGWFYAPGPERHPDAAYRDFNGWYFGLMDQQERMLADEPRMNFYHEMIRRHIGPGDHVIDLGTGTGVLAAWAAKSGAAQVHALDHSLILDTARRVASANGVERVDFVAVHSADFTLPERVDVILHEQMGDYLFDEGMVANVCDLRDRLLKPDGRILPSRFEWFCEPVTLWPDRRVPFVWEMNAHGYDYACLRDEPPEEPEYYRQASCDLGVVKAFLGEPSPALTVDLMTIDPRDGLPREVVIRRAAVRAGRLDGLAVFFRVLVDDDLALGSSPLDPDRAPHWAYRILRTDTEELAVGDVLIAELRVGRWDDQDSWRWSHTIKRAVTAELPVAGL